MSKTDKPTISKQIAQLDESIEWFYSDDFNLDEALERYNDAAKRAKSIEADLSELKNQVEVIEDFTKC